MTGRGSGSENDSWGGSQRELIVTLLFVEAAALIVSALITHATVPFDVTVYEGVASGVLAGGVPYRDVALEYPPLALAPILLPALVRDLLPSDDFGAYQTAFLALMGACAIGIGIVTVRIARAWAPFPMDPIAPLVRGVLLVVIATPFILWRFDLVPALLTGIALLLTISGSALLAGVVLAAAIATKLYPAVLVPVTVAAYVATTDYRGLREHVVGLAVTGGVLLAVTLLMMPEAIGGVMSYHFGRGVQIESTFGGIVEIGHLVGLTSGTVTDQFNSLQIDASWTPAMIAIQPLLLIGLVALTAVAAFYAFRRESMTAEGLSLRTLIGFLVAALIAFMIGSRVLSPQYLVWLLPFAPFLRRTDFVLIAVAMALTVVVFPYLYNDLIGLQPLPIWIVNVRNVLLIAVFVRILVGAGVPAVEPAGRTEHAAPSAA